MREPDYYYFLFFTVMVFKHWYRFPSVHPQRHSNPDWTPNIDDFLSRVGLGVLRCSLPTSIL